MVIFLSPITYLAGCPGGAIKLDKKCYIECEETYEYYCNVGIYRDMWKSHNTSLQQFPNRKFCGCGEDVYMAASSVKHVAIYMDIIVSFLLLVELILVIVALCYTKWGCCENNSYPYGPVRSQEV